MVVPGARPVGRRRLTEGRSGPRVLHKKMPRQDEWTRHGSGRAYFSLPLS